MPAREWLCEFACVSDSAFQLFYTNYGDGGGCWSASDYRGGDNEDENDEFLLRYLGFFNVLDSNLVERFLLPRSLP